MAGPFFLGLSALLWLLAIAALQQCASLPGTDWLLAMCVPGALLMLLRPVRKLGICLLIVGLSFSQAGLRAQWRLDGQLPEAWEGRDVLLQGRVDSLPSATVGQAGAPGWRFEFAVERSFAGPSTRDPLLPLPPQLLLSWYAQPGEDAPLLRAGERWQMLVRLKRPNGLMNPHAFDYELWLFEQDLRATGVLRPSGAVRLDAAPLWSLDAWRQRLREALQRRVADASHAGVLAALSLGDQAAITRDDWGLFRDTGVAHLLSVSGLHVTMFAWAAARLCGWLWRRSARLCLVVPAPRAALWAGVLAALVYALFSGWGVPAQRTVWMLASLALLRSIGVSWPWPLCLLASAVVVTAIDPWAVSQAGFWLSFAAVGLLMASGTQGEPSRGWKAALADGLRSQWVATLGLAPLSLLFFQQVSLVGLAANLIAIPLVSFVITPLALAGAPLPALWDAAEACVRGLMIYLRWLQAWPGAVWTLPVAPLWAQVAGLAGGALLVLPLPLRLRACGCALLLPLLWPAPVRPAEGEFELLAADIGQGTAVLLRTARHDMLYDSGPQYAPGVDAGQRVLLPLLRALGVQQLDVLMLSHRDSDHVGGAASMLAGLPTAALHSSLESSHPLLIDAPPHQRCAQGQRWAWDGVNFEVLHPLAAQYDQALKSNAMSCVLKVRGTAGRSALLTGDIEAAQELTLVQGVGAESVRSEVLLVPHHGSKTSSTDVLLDAVAPRFAVVQAGYRNRFGHPAPPVLARYQARGVQVFSAPQCGAWRWRSVDGQWSCQREVARRYWHRPTSSATGTEQAGPQPEGDAGW